MNKRAFYLRKGEPRWPLDVRSAGRRSARYPFAAERTAGATFYIFMWTLSGQGVLKAEDRQYPLKPGWIFAMPPAMPHAYGAVESGGQWDHCWLTLDGNLAKEFMVGLKLDRLIVKQTGPPNELTFQRLLDLDFDSGLHGSVERIQHVMPLLYTLSAQCHRRYRVTHRGRFSDLVSWARSNVNEHLNVDALAAKAGLTRSHFSRTFSAAHGQTPIQFVTDLKIAKSREMLSNTDKPVKWIAFECGFADAAHFCRQFKRSTGFTPKQYRGHIHV